MKAQRLRATSLLGWKSLSIASVGLELAWASRTMRDSQLKMERNDGDEERVKERVKERESERGLEKEGGCFRRGRHWCIKDRTR